MQKYRDTIFFPYRPPLVQGVDMEEYKHAMLELEGLTLGEPQTDPGDSGDETQREQEPVVGSVDKLEGKEEREEVGSDHDGGGQGEEEDMCPELLELSSANREFKPFR